MTKPQSANPPRKPNRFEMTFLFMFHGILTGAVLLTYISGDDIYFLHQFAGYVVCVAIMVRLLAATIAPKNSPLALTLPPLFAERRDGRKPGRNPIWKWMAVGLIAATAAAAVSGLMAESIGFDDLHEGLAEGFLPLFIFAHAGLVLFKPLGRWLSGVTAEDLDRAVERTVGAASTATKMARETARRVKAQPQSNR